MVGLKPCLERKQGSGRGMRRTSIGTPDWSTTNSRRAEIRNCHPAQPTPVLPDTLFFSGLQAGVLGFLRESSAVYAEGRRECGARNVESQVPVIAPPSTPTNTNMSTQIPIPGPSKKRKRPLAESQDKREGLGGPDPEDLEIAPSSASVLRVLPHG